MTQVKLKIKKGDSVKVLSGKDKGKQAKVLRVLPREGKVVLEGLFLVKKHTRPKREGEKGETVQVPSAVAVSKVMLVCANCLQAVRPTYAGKGKDKVRVCRKCRAKI